MRTLQEEVKAGASLALVQHTLRVHEWKGVYIPLSELPKYPYLNDILVGSLRRFLK